MSAFLRVRDLHTRKIIDSVELTNLSENHVQRVMLGMLRNMDTDNYFIDDSEIDKARKQNRVPQAGGEEEPK